jgi:hypothetical protein
MQISVCCGIARHNGTNERQYVVEVKLEEFLENRHDRFGKFENYGSSPWPQHTMNFTETAGAVLEVPEAEGYRYNIEAALGKR